MNVLTIGLHPDASAPLPAEEVRARLAKVRAELEQHGYLADTCFVTNGPGDAAIVETALRAKPYACICIGAGLRLVPQHTVLFETVMNVVHRLAPESRLCFNADPLDAIAAVRRVMER